MRKSEVESLLYSRCKGAEMINKRRLETILGMSQQTVNRLVADLTPFSNGGSKWFFIKDIAKILGE